MLSKGREAWLGVRQVVGSAERVEKRDEILSTWQTQAVESWKVALELRVVGHGKTFVDEKLHALILNTIMREELQQRTRRSWSDDQDDGESTGRRPMLVLISGDGNSNSDGGSTFPECCAYCELQYKIANYCLSVPLKI